MLSLNRQEIESQLIEKASTDPVFRQRLLDDPKRAIGDLLGVTLPPGMAVTVLEEQLGQHYLVLPPAAPAVDALPLDDLELALVGGGRTLRPQISTNQVTPRQTASNAKISRRSSC